MVWVCTPTSAHRPAVDAALAAGRPVFCEKPLDLDLARAQSMAEAAAASGLADPVRARAAQRPRVPCAARPGGEWDVRVRPWPPSSGTTSSSPSRVTTRRGGGPMSTQAGGGCLIEHSIHDVDILRFCFGEVRQVSARTANFAGFEGIEDLAAVTMSFASGLEAQLTSVWHEILSRGLDPSHRGVLPRRHGVARQRVPGTPAHTDRRRNRGARLPLARVGRRACRWRTTRLAWQCGPTWRRTAPSSTP